MSITFLFIAHIFIASLFLCLVLKISSGLQVSWYFGEEETQREANEKNGGTSAGGVRKGAEYQVWHWAGQSVDRAWILKGGT